MRTRTKGLITIVLLLLAGLSYLGVAIARHGFSAKEKPSRVEEFLARHARKIATPAGAKKLQNPYPSTPESLAAARAHWVDHCATCHALDGSGNTVIGRNLYPKAPDMKDAETQGLTDGELYYIISNGVRFTGMPAWGGEDSPEEIWQLVSFIRRLPNLSPEELKLMEQLAAGEAVGAEPQTQGPESKPHTHKHGRRRIECAGSSRPAVHGQSKGDREMKTTRRGFLFGGTVAAAGLLTGRTLHARQQEQHQQHQPPVPYQQPPKREEGLAAKLSPRGIPLPVVTPDVPNLPFTMDNGVKVFNLVAEPVKRQFVPFKMADVWGYNGSCPGRAIQVNEGDRVRLVFDNHLPESTTIHWHGLEVPIEMDGVPYISQQPVPPGGRYVYEFTLHQQGTYFYHAHGPMQEMMGLIGMFLIHPNKPHHPRVDHDFGLILQGWAILPNNTVPNTAAMEFNWLTINGVSSPATTPMVVRLGSRVRIRIVNLGMDHHPIHLHGQQFYITGTEGGRVPESAWYPTNTVLVGVAQAKDIEFDAAYPGDWMLHCHLPHHMMNSMADLLQDRMITTAATNEPQAMSQMQSMAAALGFEHRMPSPVAPDASSVPGFPQDAFMEMGMDEAVAKPETYGLPRNWSANMMGMMTLVRVLPPDKYDEIMALKGEGRPTKPAEHPHD